MSVFGIDLNDLHVAPRLLITNPTAGLRPFSGFQPLLLSQGLQVSPRQLFVKLYVGVNKATYFLRELFHKCILGCMGAQTPSLVPARKELTNLSFFNNWWSFLCCWGKNTSLPLGCSKCFPQHEQYFGSTGYFIESLWLEKAFRTWSPTINWYVWVQRNFWFGCRGSSWSPCHEWLSQLHQRFKFSFYYSAHYFIYLYREMYLKNQMYPIIKNTAH